MHDHDVLEIVVKRLGLFASGSPSPLLLQTAFVLSYFLVIYRLTIVVFSFKLTS